jgi:outer membrane protein assembly factor BamB
MLQHVTRRNFTASILAIATAAGSSRVLAENWPNWRGPGRDGVCATKLPEKLSQLQPAWTVKLGDSYSGPITFGKHVLVTESLNKKSETLIALERATGNQVWKKEWEGAMTVPFFAASNGDWIRATPATDGKRIVVGGMRDVVACFDAETGNEQWRIDFNKDHKIDLPSFGLVCSPLIDGEYVYVQAGGGIRQIRLADGQLGWLAMKESGGMMGGAFSSPVIAELNGTRQLVAATRDAMVGVDLASGKELWQRPIQTFRGMNILTPTIYNQQIFTSSYGGKSQAISVKAESATGWSTDVAWEGKSEAYMSSPIVVGDYAYLHLKNQRACCIDLRDGSEKWRTQPFGKYWSMVTDGERILALDESGKLYLIAANPEKFELLDQLQVSEEPCWAHLAVADNEVYIRSQRGLKMYKL